MILAEGEKKESLFCPLSKGFFHNDADQAWQTHKDGYF